MLISGEDGAGNADGFRLELWLGASGQRDGVYGYAVLSGLPCGARDRAIVFVAVGDEGDAMHHACRKRGES